MGFGNSFMKTVNLAWKTFTKMENLSKQPKDGIVMVIFRENSEDIYAGIEFAKGSKEVSSPYRGWGRRRGGRPWI